MVFSGFASGEIDSVQASQLLLYCGAQTIKLKVLLCLLSDLLSSLD